MITLSSCHKYSGPEDFDMRDATAVDLDRDGLLDLDFPVRGVRLPDINSDSLHLSFGADFSLVDLDNSGKRDILLAMTHLDERGRLQPLVPHVSCPGWD